MLQGRKKERRGSENASKDNWCGVSDSRPFFTMRLGDTDWKKIGIKSNVRWNRRWWVKKKQQALWPTHKISVFWEEGGGFGPPDQKSWISAVWIRLNELRKGRRGLGRREQLLRRGGRPAAGRTGRVTRDPGPTPGGSAIGLTHGPRVAPSNAHAHTHKPYWNEIKAALGKQLPDPLLTLRDNYQCEKLHQVWRISITVTRRGW